MRVFAPSTIHGQKRPAVVVLNDEEYAALCSIMENGVDPAMNTMHFEQYDFAVAFQAAREGGGE